MPRRAFVTGAVVHAACLVNLARPSHASGSDGARAARARAPHSPGRAGRAFLSFTNTGTCLGLLGVLVSSPGHLVPSSPAQRPVPGAPPHGRSGASES